MIGGMRKQAWAFLLIGFVAGFAALYTWTKKRAPDVVRAMPLPVEERNVSGSSAPPVDIARVQQLQTEIKNNPKNVEALVELANMHFEQKNYKDAIGFYTKALELRPSNANVRTDLATAMFYENRFDDAIAQFKTSLEMDPNNPRTLFNMGVTMLHGKNDLEACLKYWEKLVEANPNFPQVEFVKEQIRILKDRQKGRG
ncbi:MAG: hypothetical protein DMG13_15205 [Acidobacteria bacterium]|nr:MAG: hypothetical protein DMG13_15205 [Acidobacteriota bacterium]